MKNHTHIHIHGNHNIVNVNQSNYVSGGGCGSGIGCGLVVCGCLIVFFIIYIISVVSIVALNVKLRYKPLKNWFEPVHGSHINQINYRKSCQLCKDELCDYILKEHIDEYNVENYGRIHFSDSTKEKCPICKFNLKLSKTELNKIYSESLKSIQYIPIFFEEYPIIDNDILAISRCRNGTERCHGCIPRCAKSVRWINKTKSI